MRKKGESGDSPPKTAVIIAGRDVLEVCIPACPQFALIDTGSVTHKNARTTFHQDPRT